MAAVTVTRRLFQKAFSFVFRLPFCIFGLLEVPAQRGASQNGSSWAKPIHFQIEKFSASILYREPLKTFFGKKSEVTPWTFLTYLLWRIQRAFFTTHHYTLLEI